MTQKHPVIHVRPKSEKDRKFWDALFDIPNYGDGWLEDYLQRPRKCSFTASNMKQATKCEISLGPRDAATS